jgi:hypothetical protein
MFSQANSGRRISQVASTGDNKVLSALADSAVPQRPSIQKKLGLDVYKLAHIQSSPMGIPPRALRKQSKNVQEQEKNVQNNNSNERAYYL